MFLREHRIGELRLGVDARRAEVVAQAERVADLVHRRVLEVGVDEGLGLGTVGVELAARLEHVGGIAQLLGGELAIGADPAAHQHGPLLGRGVAAAERVVHAAGREDLRARRADIARRQAFDADGGVENLAAARIDVTRADRAEGRRGIRHPADRGAAEIERVEIGVVGLHLDMDGVLEADLLEGLVPLEHAGRDRRAVLERHRAVDPVDDRLDRLGERRVGILLLEPPAVDVALPRRALQVVAEIEATAFEVADARVGLAAMHRLGRQSRQRIVDAEKQAARIGHGTRRRRLRHARRRARLRHRDRRGRVVAEHLENEQIRRRPRFGDRRIARVERVALAIAALQIHAEAEQVGEEQRVRLDQHRLALGLGQAQHRRAREQAGRIGGLDRERFRRSGPGEVADVAPDQLHLVVDAAELDDPAVLHQAAEEAAFADAALKLGRKKEGLVEVFRLQLEPELVVLLPDRDRPVAALGVLDDFGERAQGARRGGDRRCARWAQARGRATRADRADRRRGAASRGGDSAAAAVESLEGRAAGEDDASSDDQTGNAGKRREERGHAGGPWRRNGKARSMVRRQNGSRNWQKSRSALTPALARLAEEGAKLSASAESAAVWAWRLLRRGASSCRPRTPDSCRRRRTTSSRLRQQGCGWRCGRGTSGRG